MDATTALAILQVISLSALATDCLQTQSWIDGTLDNPLATPAGGLVYETNPVLAGRPSELDSYFSFLEAVTCAAPQMLPLSWATSAQALWAAAALANAIHNNELARREGLPQYWMLSYRWHF